MIVTFLLADDQPPFRKLWEGELPAVPDAGEPIGFNGRVYRVVERSWRFGAAKPVTNTVLGMADVPGEQPIIQLAVGVLLTQIDGSPHVTVNRSH